VPLLGLFLGCRKSSPERPYTETRRAMGTFAEVTLYGVDPDRAPALAESAFKRLNDVEKALSIYDEQSQLSKLNRAAATEFFQLTRELKETLLLADKAHGMTSGGFDPTVGPLSRLWKRAARDESLPAQEEIAAALSVCGWRRLEWESEGRDALLLPVGCVVDLGGVAKGYGVDQAAETLIGGGAPAGIVNVGGDLRAWGRPPGRETFSIGVRHPRKGPSDLAGVLSVGSTGVVTSGDYEQGFVHEGKRYSHVVDPRTGWPAQGVLSVTVLSRSAGLADAVATGLMALGKEDALEAVAKWPAGLAEVLLFVEEEGECVGYATPGILDRWSPGQGGKPIPTAPIRDVR